MQEEAGSVTGVQEETETKEKKAKAKRKPRSIPTVEDIVSAENAAKKENSEPSEKNEKASEQTETAPVQTESVPEQTDVVQKETATAPEQTEVQEEKTEEESSLPEDDLDSEERAALEARRASMNLESETALLETVLFLESEPQNTENLSKITQFSVNVVEECLSRLKEKYSAPDSGIELSQIIGGWILTPKKDCFDLVKERYGKKNEGRLSKAAIETLSIIAYSQPITRAEIESIRHVNVDNMMRILLDRRFIKEVGKKDVPGKPIMYGTTKEFLEFFNLQSISDLPQLDEKESERFELAR